MPRIRVLWGDLTAQAVDAIVNAANQKLLGGGGVDGAIHRAAGPALLDACRAIPQLRPGVRCPTGEARITPGFGLSARYVIHTVGPVYAGRPEDATKLASAYRTSLQLAVDRALESIAFPAISCGAYGYPPEDAAFVARQVIEERAWALSEIRLVLLSESLLSTWREVFG